MKGEGAVRKIVGGLPHVAQVEVTTSESEATHIVVRCDGDGWIRQGSIEDASADGYQEWKDAAVIGVRYALTSSDRTARVTINRISGLVTDTNSTAVAIAAARSVWNSLSLSPREWINDGLDELLKTAWEDNPRVAQHLIEEIGGKGAAPSP